MKLIQLNCWAGKLASQLERFLREEQPDILCLQEAVDLPKGDGIVFTTIEEIQKYIEADNSFLSPVFTFNFMNRKATFGNCIISKYPIIKSETLFTYEGFVEQLDYKERHTNMRNLQHAVIEVPNKKRLHILNHHGYHVPHHKNGDDETLRQCQIIADYADALKGPAVLTGDFNLVPRSESIEKINKVMENLTLKKKLRTTRTILTHKKEACDYIFVRDVRVNNFHASNTIVSDHKALILEFDA